MIGDFKKQTGLFAAIRQECDISFYTLLTRYLIIKEVYGLNGYKKPASFY